MLLAISTGAWHELPEITLTNERSEPLTVKPFIVRNSHATDQADLLEVAVAGHLRLIDSASAKHVTDATDVYLAD